MSNLAGRSEASPSSHQRDRMVTLPPIRDIFREQLASPSPHSQSRPPRSTSISGSLRSIYANDPNPYQASPRRPPSASPDMRFSRGENNWSSASSSPSNAAPILRPSHSCGGPSPSSSGRPLPEHGGSRRSSPNLPTTRPYPPPSGYRYAPSPPPGHSRGALSRPGSMDGSSRPAAAANDLWTEHRRRDSADSLWSSETSSSSASSHLRSIPPSTSLQFQPLPHAQGASVYSRPPDHVSAHNPANPVSTDFQSPFGVLIADGDQRGASGDPQRTAIMRTLRASGQQGSFQITFDDHPASAQNAPRYSCSYCGKGFARPSSLRIHINSHTGEKPFQCPHPDCGRRFSVHSNMRRHYRVHGGDVPKNGESSGDEAAEE